MWLRNVGLTAFLVVGIMGLPFVGGASPVGETRQERKVDYPVAASLLHAETETSALWAMNYAPSDEEVDLTKDFEHLAQKPVPLPPPPATASAGDRRAYYQSQGLSCPGSPGGGGSAPGITSAGGVGGTTTDDIRSFSATYNAIRVANCLPPIPPGNFRYDSCMETRLFWMAEDPSTDPSSAWGHIGSVRSDGVPSVGCDGNLAGGSGNTGATVAQKWWDSGSHRASLYRPGHTASTNGVCIYFAMTHGGIPNEPYSFTRAAARWGSC